jgi:ubiquinol-cytochrome c reductase cytochrome c1 subunit
MRRHLIALAAAIGLAAATGLVSPAQAQFTEAPPLPHENWSFSGIFGTYDRASAQRGFQVYREVCSACHSMNQLYYRNLAGIGLSDDQIKAVAASVQVPGGLDDSGNPVERPGTPADHFRAPFPNDKAASAANNGAIPPDQSLLVNAREGGPDYIYALLNGYGDPPPGMTIAPGLYYNKYFPGGQIHMPPPLVDGRVTYTDGTKATVPQMAHDVTTFLTWAANPEMEQRKRIGVKIVLFLVFMTGITYAVKRSIWADVH